MLQQISRSAFTADRHVVSKTADREQLFLSLLYFCLLLPGSFTETSCRVVLVRRISEEVLIHNRHETQLILLLSFSGPPRTRSKSISQTWTWFCSILTCDTAGLLKCNAPPLLSWKIRCRTWFRYFKCFTYQYVTSCYILVWVNTGLWLGAGVHYFLL